MNPKPVYSKLLKLIKEDWMTKNLSLKANKKGEVNFRGFIGSYEITVTKEDGTKQTVSLHLSEVDKISGYLKFNGTLKCLQ